MVQQHSAALLAYTLQNLNGVTKVTNVKDWLGKSNKTKVPHTIRQLLSTRLTVDVFVAHTLCVGRGVQEWWCAGVVVVGVVCRGGGGIDVE